MSRQGCSGGPRLSRRAFVAAVAASILVSGCRRDAPAAPKTRRIVSISPSTTEAVFAVGAGAELVGRSRYCDIPAEALRLPTVGGYADPSVEAIVALAPTLVVGAHGPAGPALDDALRAHGIETWFPETESIEQIEAMLAGLGKRVGRDAEAARLVESLRDRVRGVESAVSGLPRPRAVMLFDVAPIVAAGPGSFPDELIRRAGGDNLVRRGGEYPTIGIEHLLALDPDIVLDGVSDGGAEVAGRIAALRTQPGWSELRAMREGRVRSIHTSAVLRPGPRIGDGLAALARALHGDALLQAGAEAPR